MLKQLLAGLLLLLHHAYLSNSQTCTDGNLRLVCCQNLMIAYKDYRFYNIAPIIISM